jgi:hypothetical protein
MQPITRAGLDLYPEKCILVSAEGLRHFYLPIECCTFAVMPLPSASNDKTQEYSTLLFRRGGA